MYDLYYKQSRENTTTTILDHVMIDFVALTPAEGKKYSLVVVDMCSKWVEAFPEKHASSFSVAKAFLTEIIP